jgi:hypothetical protein
MTKLGRVRSLLCWTAVAIAVIGLSHPVPATASHAAQQGFGADTAGGAGGAVVRVTNLNDSGPGSLRAAVSGSNRTIVFDVAGEIRLSDYLWVQGSNLTIDGFTAPAPGITLRGHGLAIHGTATSFFSCGSRCYGVHDVIVRNLRIRAAAADGIRIAHNARRIVLDHVSVHGSGDGNLDISESEDVTVQWSVFAEPADTQKNSLIKYNPRRVTLHHNLFTAARQRNPQVRIDDNGTQATGTTIDMRNNVVFNWFAGYGTLLWYGPRGNVVANYYASPASTDGVQGRAVEVSNGAHAYVSGNVSGDGAGVNGEGTETSPFPAPAVTTSSACVAAQAVLAGAGAQPRDAVDDRYVDAVTLAGCSGGSTPPPPPPAPAVADLSVSGLTGPGSATAGGTLTVGVTTRNVGTASAGASTTRLYLSTDAAVDSGDAVLGNVAVPALSAGQASTSSATVTVPAGTAAGSYRIVARADATGAVSEGSESNNVASLALSVAGASSGAACQRCDLLVKSVAGPDSVRTGTPFTVSVRVLSVGSGATPATTVRFYLSTSRDSLAGAIDLGGVAVPALAPSQGTRVSRTVTVPVGTREARYRLHAVVDPDSVVAETNEGNNDDSDPLTVR